AFSRRGRRGNGSYAPHARHARRPLGVRVGRSLDACPVLALPRDSSHGWPGADRRRARTDSGVDRAGAERAWAGSPSARAAALAADKAEALGLDVARFNRYERDTVVRAAGRVDLEALLNSSASAWEGFHDWFFPPHCVWRVDRPPTVVFCDGCPSPERVAESHF